MPVRVRKRGDKWCVVEPDGTVVESGCYDDEGEAEARRDAMNINMEKEAMTDSATVSSENITSFKDTTTQVISSGSNSAHDWFLDKDGVWHTKKEDRPTEKKSAHDEIYFAESFEELDAAREMIEEEHKMKQLLNDFMTLVGNVLAYPGAAPQGVVKRLAQDLASRLPAGSDKGMHEEEEYEEEEKELGEKEKWSKAYINDLPDSAFFFIESGGSKDSEGKTTPRNLRHLPYKDKNGKVDLPHVRNAISRAGSVKLKDGSKISESEASEIKERARKILSQNTKDTFLVWKQDDGTYRWLGVYSNKFRDDDNPAEILAEKAHLKFIERVESGDLDYPDLYVWHIQSPIGKTDTLAYDDSGFSITSGTIDEDFAIALEKSEEDWAMSHGMPAEHIRRDKDDPTIIVEYISTEVSVLPRWAAANKMTRFSILKEEEPMAIIPDEKRQHISKLLGEELTLKLESGLLNESEKAIADGIEFKEEQQEEAVTEDAAETEETVEEKEELADTEETVEEPAQEAETGEEVATEQVAEAEPEEVATSEEDTAGERVDKEELATALAAIFEAVTKSNEEVAKAISSLNDRVEAMESSMADLTKEDSEKVAEIASNTPTASLLAMLAGKLPAEARSVIGTPEAYVHGNNKLAKDKPEEAPEEPEGLQKGGLFFGQWS